MTPSLESRTGLLLRFPDNRLGWETGAPQIVNPRFRVHVDRIYGEMPR